MTRIVWKFSFTLYTSNDDSSFRKKYQFWLKNVSLFKKQLIDKVESSEVQFWSKPRIQNSANLKPLNLEVLTQLTCFVFIMIGEMLLSYRKCPKIQVRRGLGQLTAKNLFARARTILGGIHGAE